MVVFSLSRGLGDPRHIMLPDVGYGIDQEKWDKLGDQLHLNDPVPVQFGYWVSDLLRGDLGYDLTDDRPIGPKIVKKLGATLWLAIPAWVIATLIGVPMGVLSAIKRGSILDYAMRGFALGGQAVPVFWLALLAILIFAVWLDWLPPATMGEGLAYKNYVMPVLTLAWLPAAGYLRLTRSAMLEVLDSEYIKLAQTKGVSRWTVIWKHHVQERRACAFDGYRSRTCRLHHRVGAGRDGLCMARDRAVHRSSGVGQQHQRARRDHHDLHGALHRGQLPGRHALRRDRSADTLLVAEEPM